MSLTPTSLITAPPKGVAVILAEDITVDETKSVIACPGVSIKNHTLSIVATGLTGAVQMETSHDPTFTGAWSPLGGGPVDLSTVVGVLEFTFSNVVLNAVRFRISTVVSGPGLKLVYTGQ